jgi:hypothetical protein
VAQRDDFFGENGWSLRLWALKRVRAAVNSGIRSTEVIPSLSMVFFGRKEGYLPKNLLFTTKLLERYADFHGSLPYGSCNPLDFDKRKDVHAIFVDTAFDPNTKPDLSQACLAAANHLDESRLRVACYKVLANPKASPINVHRAIDWCRKNPLKDRLDPRTSKIFKGALVKCLNNHEGKLSTQDQLALMEWAENIYKDDHKAADLHTMGVRLVESGALFEEAVIAKAFSWAAEYFSYETADSHIRFCRQQLARPAADKIRLTSIVKGLGHHDHGKQHPPIAMALLTQAFALVTTPEETQASVASAKRLTSNDTISSFLKGENQYISRIKPANTREIGRLKRAYKGAVRAPHVPEPVQRACQACVDLLTAQVAVIAANAAL